MGALSTAEAPVQVYGIGQAFWIIFTTDLWDSHFPRNPPFLLILSPQTMASLTLNERQVFSLLWLAVSHGTPKRMKLTTYGICLWTEDAASWLGFFFFFSVVSTEEVEVKEVLKVPTSVLQNHRYDHNNCFHTSDPVSSEIPVSTSQEHTKQLSIPWTNETIC